MVKLYKNRYIRKYQEDFLLSLFSKPAMTSAIGHHILQKHKYITIGKSRNASYVRGFSIYYLKLLHMELFNRMRRSSLFLRYKGFRLYHMRNKLRQRFKFLASRQFKSIFLHAFLRCKAFFFNKNLSHIFWALKKIFSGRSHVRDINQIAYIAYYFHFKFLINLRQISANDIVISHLKFSLATVKYRDSSIYMVEAFDNQSAPLYYHETCFISESKFFDFFFMSSPVVESSWEYIQQKAPNTYKVTYSNQSQTTLLELYYDSFPCLFQFDLDFITHSKNYFESYNYTNAAYSLACVNVKKSTS